MHLRALLPARARPPRPGLPRPAVLATVVTLLLAGLAPAAAARPPEGAAVLAPRAGWAWPLAPRPAVVRGYDAHHTRYGPGHRGVDLAAAPGQEVLAASAGAVSFAGPVAGRPLVVVAHRGGLRTTYEPVVPGVRRGDVVRAGQVVGHLAAGPVHCLGGPCLHWGARLGEDYRDPLRLLSRPPPPVLLPLRLPLGGARPR